MKVPTLLFIYNVMVEFYGMEFISHSRRRTFADKRKIFSLVARHYGYSYHEIQMFLKLKSHGTVVVACDTMIKLMSVYDDFKRQYDYVISQIEDSLMPQVIENW